MEMNYQGCTLCNTIGEERYKKYCSKIGRKVYKGVQYDYRHTDGELFACCAPTLEEARRRRDIWIKSKI